MLWKRSSRLSSFLSGPFMETFIPLSRRTRELAFAYTLIDLFKCTLTSDVWKLQPHREGERKDMLKIIPYTRANLVQDTLVEWSISWCGQAVHCPRLNEFPFQCDLWIPVRPRSSRKVWVGSNKCHPKCVTPPSPFRCLDVSDRVDQPTFQLFSKCSPTISTQGIKGRRQW